MEFIERKFKDKSSALFFISALEGKQLVYFQREGDYIVAHQRGCIIIDGECEKFEEEKINDTNNAE